MTPYHRQPTHHRCIKCLDCGCETNIQNAPGTDRCKCGSDRLVNISYEQ